MRPTASSAPRTSAATRAGSVARRDPAPRGCIVVSGMHRSGTSLVASLLAASGVHLGDRLLPPSHGNVRGHFEDRDVYELHERLLEARSMSAFRVSEDFRAEPTEHEEARARRLAADRAGNPWWGFKDPRAALFLPLWSRVLPEASFLLVYRHPVEVALSLMRRAIDLDVVRNPRTAVRTWSLYNRRILEFHRAHRERTVLWNIAGATRSLSTALELLALRFGLPVPRDAESVFAPRELRQGLLAPEIDWRSIAPEALELYDDLEERADLPGGDPCAPLDGRSSSTPGEREYRIASEYLLGTSLSRAARSSGEDAPPPPPDLRVDFSELRLELARRDRELERLSAELAALRAATADSRATRASAEAERLRIERSRGMRLLRFWWSRKAAARRGLEALRRLLGR